MTNEQKLQRLRDRADGIISKKIGIDCAIRLLTRKNKELTKQWGDVQKKIQALKSEVAE